MIPGLAAAYDGPVEKDAPLADKTTFRLGGPADWLFTPQRHEQVGPLLAFLRARALPVTVLGEGSNVLIRDGGVRGAVIRIGRDLGGLAWEGELAVCGAGLPSRSLARRALDEGRGGFAWAAALPGNLGGALCGNAGAFGGEMADSFVWLEGWSAEGAPLRLARGELDFGYRRCGLPGGAVVTRLALRLPPLEGETRAREEARYREALSRRAATQPGGLWTAGSTFKNPPGEAAGRLLDACGLKGRRVGAAMVSPRHANFIVAAPEAQGTPPRAADVEALMALMAAEVERICGVRLEREIRIYGEA